MAIPALRRPAADDQSGGRTAGPKSPTSPGATFIVNGRPFNGTGAGFNELAKAGEPRLNARRDRRYVRS